MLIDNNEVEIDSGDGVIYLGIEDVHARKGEYQELCTIIYALCRSKRIFYSSCK